jgi:hypothetical protein
MATCSYNRPLPNPPTPSAACAVPLGGSNTTLLDVCCNGHINPIRQYGAPGEDECYQYCTTETVDEVIACFSRPENLGPYDANNPTWSCYNAVEANEENRPVFEGGVARIGIGKAMVVILGLGLVSAVMGS